jgi:hypothetical protein
MIYYNIPQRSAAQHRTAQRSAAQHRTAQGRAGQCSAVQHRAARHLVRLVVWVGPDPLRDLERVAAEQDPAEADPVPAGLVVLVRLGGQAGGMHDMMVGRMHVCTTLCMY